MLKVYARKLNAVEILSLEGQIINGDAESLTSAVRLSHADDIILDFSNVTMIDAHGLGVLLQLREQSLANGIQLKLMNMSERLSRVFEITRLNTVFEINPGREFLMAA